jgi:hypothetical protein
VARWKQRVDARDGTLKAPKATRGRVDGICVLHDSVANFSNFDTGACKMSNAKRRAGETSERPPSRAADDRAQRSFQEFSRKQPSMSAGSLSSFDQFFLPWLHRRHVAASCDLVLFRTKSQKVNLKLIRAQLA